MHAHTYIHTYHANFDMVGKRMLNTNYSLLSLFYNRCVNITMANTPSHNSHHEYWTAGSDHRPARVFASAIITVSFGCKYSSWFHCSHKYINQSSKILFGEQQNTYYASSFCQSNTGEIFSVIPVYGVLKHYVLHWCGFDISEVGLDFELRNRATHDYM